MTVVIDRARLRDYAGLDLGRGDWHRITQKQVDGYAAASLDRQWIHTDPEAAARGPFGGTIAHGFLLLSLIPRLTESLFDVEGCDVAVNYQLDRVRFRRPVLVGSRVRAAVVLLGARARPRGLVEVRTAVSIQTDTSPTQVACSAEHAVLFDSTDGVS